MNNESCFSFHTPLKQMYLFLFVFSFLVLLCYLGPQVHSLIDIAILGILVSSLIFTVDIDDGIYFIKECHFVYILLRICEWWCLYKFFSTYI